MIEINDSRLSVTRLLTGVFLLLLSATSQAALIFTGQNIDVGYNGDDVSVATTSIIANNDAEPEIFYGDGSSIGNGLMLDSEYINFTDNTVIFQLRGDGDTLTTGIQTTGLDGSYILTLTDPGIWISSVSIESMENILGLSMGTDITFDASSIFFDVSAFGIFETSGPDLGVLTLNVQFVPLPAALPLMLSGLAGLLLFNRRKKSV